MVERSPRFRSLVQNAFDIITLVEADGAVRYVEVTNTNLLGDPSVNGVVINSRDITERKRAEEETARLRRAPRRRRDQLNASPPGGMRKR